MSIIRGIHLTNETKIKIIKLDLNVRLETCIPNKDNKCKMYLHFFKLH